MLLIPKYLSQPRQIRKKYHLKTFFKISFDNKAIEKINACGAFRNPLVKLLNQPLHKFVKNFGVNAFLDDNCTLLCDYTCS